MTQTIETKQDLPAARRPGYQHRGFEPAAVELPITGEIGGVAVRGYVDLLDTIGRVIELKSAAREPKRRSCSHLHHKAGG